MEVSETGIAFIKNLEDFRAEAYKDSAGVWTIGYGRTESVKPGDTTTREKAEEDLRIYLARTSVFLTNALKVVVNQHQFDALCSFTYNIGEHRMMGSTLMQLLNLGAPESVPDQMLRWKYITVHGYKQESEGLLYRRKHEADMWTNGPRETVLNPQAKKPAWEL